MTMSKTRLVRQARREAAEARQAVYDKMTLQQKLDSLPKEGAKKQRAKLEAALAAKQIKPEPSAVVEDKPKKTYQKKAKS